MLGRSEQLNLVIVEMDLHAIVNSVKTGRAFLDRLLIAFGDHRDDDSPGLLSILRVFVRNDGRTLRPERVITLCVIQRQCVLIA